MSALANKQPVGDDWAMDQCPDVLAKIYDEEVSIAIWQRDLHPDVDKYLTELLRNPKKITLKLSGSPEQLMEEVHRAFPSALMTDKSCISAAEFYEDIHQVVEMFSCLFDAKTLGLRINTLEHAMCPRFHVDNIALRLITTYYGLATQWLPDQVSNRSALSSDLANQVATPGAITDSAENIQSMSAGDVALFKGELWQGNEGRGIVHRSPSVTNAQPRRLVVTCDLIE